MKRYNRIIFKDNTVLNDFSPSLGDYFANTETIALGSAEDSIMIGSYLPWNHRYIDVSTANDQTAALSVEIWDGSDWTAAADIVDETASAGASLAQSGYVFFTVDKDSKWGRENSTEDITALSSMKIYNMFWARFTWNADLNANTALNYIGWRFSNDNELGSYYPDLLDAALLDSFESGKTNWNDQHFIAADHILMKLEGRGEIWTPNTILEPSRFLHASIEKTAEIIFKALGDDYEDNRKNASSEFHKLINSPVKDLDSNQDGFQQTSERREKIGIYRT